MRKNTKAYLARQQRSADRLCVVAVLFCLYAIASALLDLFFEKSIGVSKDALDDAVIVLVGWMLIYFVIKAWLRIVGSLYADGD